MKTHPTPNPELRDYVEREILPRYRDFDRAHNLDHVHAVIARSLALAADYAVNPDMVYAIAAYHDTGLVHGRENHHLDAGRILEADAELRRWFREEEIRTMREAVEDHRASSSHAPRSIYGRIVAEADRQIDPATIIRRTIQYGLAHYPELDREGHYARCLEHLTEKYAEDGYLRLWIAESENARQLEALRRIIRNPEELRRRFDATFDSEQHVPAKD
ncbi:HD domain-containing protein [Alistipes sp.]|uniref:HD domain-containing protein n=1 Tax=Alistipes sp. TaxID=1872444 RepID=UPI003A85C9A6